MLSYRSSSYTTACATLHTTPQTAHCFPSMHEMGPLAATLRQHPMHCLVFYIDFPEKALEQACEIRQDIMLP